MGQNKPPGSQNPQTSNLSALQSTGTKTGGFNQILKNELPSMNKPKDDSSNEPVVAFYIPISLSDKFNLEKFNKEMGQPPLDPNQPEKSKITESNKDQEAGEEAYIALYEKTLKEHHSFSHKYMKESNYDEKILTDLEKFDHSCISPYQIPTMNNFKSKQNVTKSDFSSQLSKKKFTNHSRLSNSRLFKSNVSNQGISDSLLKKRVFDSNIDYDQIKINVEILNGQYAEIFINCDSLVSTLIKEIFVTNNALQNQKNITNHYIEFENKIVLSNSDLKSNGITHNSKVKLKISENQSQRELLPKKNLVPKLTKKGYETKPPYHEICRMKKSELGKIQNFTIENEYGKIMFQNDTNIIGLNLDDIVEINNRSIDLYPDEVQRPAVGKGLNKPAIMTFYGFHKKLGLTEEEWIIKLKKWCKKINAGFVEWNTQNNTLVIFVQNL